MGEFFFAVIALVVLMVIKMPGKVYDVTAERYSRRFDKSLAEWEKLVTLGNDEEREILNDILRSEIDAIRNRASCEMFTEFDALREELKKQYPEYKGGYGEAIGGGKPERIQIGVQRMMLAKRGKLRRADASVMGFPGNRDDAPFVLWIDSQLKEHGIDEKVYFTSGIKIYAMDNIPKNTYGEYKWDPQINRRFKRPE